MLSLLERTIVHAQRVLKQCSQRTQLAVAKKLMTSVDALSFYQIALLTVAQRHFPHVHPNDDSALLARAKRTGLVQFDADMNASFLRALLGLVYIHGCPRAHQPLVEDGVVLALYDSLLDEVFLSSATSTKRPTMLPFVGALVRFPEILVRAGSSETFAQKLMLVLQRHGDAHYRQGLELLKDGTIRNLLPEATLLFQAFAPMVVAVASQWSSHIATIAIDTMCSATPVFAVLSTVAPSKEAKDSMSKALSRSADIAAIASLLSVGDASSLLQRAHALSHSSEFKTRNPLVHARITVMLEALSSSMIPRLIPRKQLLELWPDLALQALSSNSVRVKLAMHQFLITPILAGVPHSIFIVPTYVALFAPRQPPKYRLPPIPVLEAFAKQVRVVCQGLESADTTELINELSAADNGQRESQNPDSLRALLAKLHKSDRLPTDDAFSALAVLLLVVHSVFDNVKLYIAMESKTSDQLERPGGCGNGAAHHPAGAEDRGKVRIAGIIGRSLRAMKAASCPLIQPLCIFFDCCAVFL